MRGKFAMRALWIAASAGFDKVDVELLKTVKCLWKPQM